MKYFQNINNLEELRTAYRALLKKFHPDNGGSEEATKEINVEYEKLFQILKNQSGSDQEEAKYNTEEDESLRDALNSIINLNVDIEICGSWIWVSGNTYPVKESLKAAGFKFSKNKKAWYWHTGEYTRRGKKVSLDYIRTKYGSETVKKSQEEKRACIA